MHSHPGRGWQGMSRDDTLAERDVLAYPAGATGLPLIGLTIGADGYWSARFWEKLDGQMTKQQCSRVRVVGPDTYRHYFDDKLAPPPARREVLKRTIDSWGDAAQNDLSRLNIGIVGLGSVGCIVAEAMARVGVSKFTLIDHDKVKKAQPRPAALCHRKGCWRAQGSPGGEENTGKRYLRQPSGHLTANVGS